VAISFVNAATTALGFTNSVAIAVPASVVSGDVMIAVLCGDGGSVVNSTPSGWTARASITTTGGGGAEVTCQCFTKTAGGSEPASYTWGFATSRFWAGTIMAYRGALESTWANVTPTEDFSTSHSCPTETTTDDHEWGFTFAALRNETPGAPTGPSGLNTRTRFNSNSQVGLVFTDYDVSPAGTTTAVVFSSSGTRAAGMITAQLKQPGTATTDGDTLALKLTPSATEISASGDTATEALALAPSVVESGPIVDAGTLAFKLDAITSVEGPADVSDTAIEQLKFTPSAAEVFTHGYVDSGTETFKLTPVGFESQTAYLDQGTERLALTPAALFSHGTSDSGIDLFHLSPTSEDHYCPEKVEFEGDLVNRWEGSSGGRWAASVNARWTAEFLGIGGGFAC
jgi:hypothetical protein